MKAYRIRALILRYLYSTRDIMKVTEFLFWPMIDIGFFGLIALWSGSMANEPGLVRTFVTGLVLWQIIYRGNFEVCVNTMDEIVEQNFVNLATSPLRMGEWIISLMGSGLIKIIFTLFYGASVGWLFFGVNVFSIGPIFFLFVLYCLISGWIIGFVGAGLVLIKGHKLYAIPWILAMLTAIVSAVFYPIDILPRWLQMVSQSLPMSYIFQGLRQLLQTESLSWNVIGLITVLSIFYLALAIKFFLYIFKRSRNRGLNQLK